MKWYKLNAKYLLYYFILSLLSLLYIFPIILANLYYKDDFGWSLNGSIGLKGDGRPLGEYLVLLLSGGSPVTDSAPLSLILSILFLSYALVLYAKTNLDSISDNYMIIPVLLLILANPLSMECLAYRYGTSVMFTALGIPFVIFSIPRTISRLKLFVYSVILSIAFLSLYQTAIGVCLILLILAFFLEIIIPNEARPLSGFFLQEGIRVAGIGVGAVFYKLVIARHYIRQSYWQYGASQTLDFKLSSVKTIIDNIMIACGYVKDFVSETALWYQAVLGFAIISALAAILFFYCKETGQTGKRKAFGIAFLLFSPALVFIATFLPIMLLKQQALKARNFIALGCFLFYLGVLLLHYGKNYKTFVYALFVLCLLYHFSYIYSFGSALTTQNEYAKYLLYNIANDLETISAETEVTTVSFAGEMPKSKRIQTLYDKYPIYVEMLPTYFTNNSWMGGAWVLQYLPEDFSLEEVTEEDEQIIYSAEPVVENTSYSCYVNSEKIIVSFE